MDVEDDLRLALRVASDAGRLALEAFNAGSPARSKDDGTIVTEADAAVEHFLQTELRKWRPDDAVLGEELGRSGTGRRRWIIDPIDGTSNFVEKNPEWGVNIALQDGDELVLGMVEAPALGQRWWAARGLGAFQSATTESSSERRRLRVSDRRSLDDARVSAWLHEDDLALGALRALAGWEEPTSIAMMFRVPSGTLDALVDGTPSMVWDRAPLIVLVEEAGGRYSDLGGGRNFESSGGFFTNGQVHDGVRRLVLQARGPQVIP